MLIDHVSENTLLASMTMPAVREETMSKPEALKFTVLLSILINSELLFLNDSNTKQKRFNFV